MHTIAGARTRVFGERPMAHLKDQLEVGVNLDVVELAVVVSVQVGEDPLLGGRAERSCGGQQQQC